MHKNQLVTFKNLSLSFSDKLIFDSVSGDIPTGAKIGLVGINGAGKSSLLKILNGDIKPSSGKVSRHGLISYVPQLNLDELEDIAVYSYIEEQFTDWWEVLSKLEELFSLKIDSTQKISNLSGGEVMKLNLAIALTRDPDLLLLDEPTNHLDLSSQERLIQILKRKELTLLVVSHNISFLNAVTNEIWAIKNKKKLILMVETTITMHR